MRYALSYIRICCFLFMTSVGVQATDFIDNNRGVIPFELVDGLIILEMEVGGIKGNYVLDSGAETIIINRPAARNDALFVTVHGEREGQRGEATIKLGSYTHSAMEVWYVDLEDVSTRLSAPIDGLVGASLLEDQDIMIDYELNRIVLMGHSDYRLAASNTRRVVTVPFDQHHDNMPVVHATIDGSVIRMGFDTGANTTVFSSTLGVKHDVHLSLGDLMVKDTPYITADLAKLEDGMQRSIDGILSASSIGANQIVISYRQERIYLMIDQSLTID